MAVKKFWPAFVAAMFFTLVASAQSPASYKLEFLKAKMIEAVGEKQVLVLFKVSAANKKDFPPILSAKVTYSLGDRGKERTVAMNKSNTARVVVFDRSIRQKSPLVYSYVKDKLDVTSKENFIVLAFYIKTEPEDEYNKMTFTYGLWEKRNPKQRTEQKFEFALED